MLLNIERLRQMLLPFDSRYHNSCFFQIDELHAHLQALREMAAKQVRIDSDQSWTPLKIGRI